MKISRRTTVLVGISAIALTGGVVAATAGGASPPRSSSAGGAGKTNSPTTPTVRAASVSVGTGTEKVLVDSAGLPLYFYRPDTASASKVMGQLAALWPPVVTKTPTAMGGIGTVSTLATGNGHQVKYNGHFLYAFVGDSPGHATGQDVQNFFLATPSLGANTPVAPPPTTVTSPQSGATYGY